MEVVSKLDEIGRPAWLSIMIVGFVLWWPAGLGVLAFLIISGRLRPRCGGRGRWFNMEQQAGAWGAWGERGSKRGFRAKASGNSAFDEYREETLRRLEDEQKEFQEYLERLRQARDKAEFDQFMAERRNRGGEVDKRPE